MTSLLRGPLGGAVLGIFPMTADPDRLRVVGHDVLLLRHRAHFTHAVRVLLAAAELVNDIAVPQQDGFAAVARFVTDAAADAAVVIATLGVHDRMTTSVRSQRASNGSGASQRAEQNSSTYHSSDNETDTRINIHTHIHTYKYVHVYYRLQCVKRSRICYLCTFTFILFLSLFFSLFLSPSEREIVFGLRNIDDNRREPAFHDDPDLCVRPCVVITRES